MKKTVKSVFLLLFVLSIVIIAPVRADAKTYKDSTEVVRLYPKASPEYGQKQTLEFTVTKKKAKNIQLSDKSIAKVTSEKFEGNDIYRFNVVPKKTGVVTITYKDGNETHKLKMIIRKYINPYKKITINGVDITKKFDKTNVCYFDYNKYKGKKVTISTEKKGNWIIEHGDYLTKSYDTIECLGVMKTKVEFKVTKKNSIAWLCMVDPMDRYEQREACKIIFK